MNNKDAHPVAETRRLKTKQRLLQFITIPLAIELAGLILTVLSDVMIPQLGFRILQVLLLINLVLFIFGLFLVVTSTARENAAQSLLTTAGAFRMKTQEEVLALRRKEIGREMSSWFASVLILGQALVFLILIALLFFEQRLIYLYLVLGLPLLTILVVKERQVAKILTPSKQTGRTTAGINFHQPTKPQQQPVRIEFDVVRGLNTSLALIGAFLILYVLEVVVLATTAISPALRLFPLFLDNEILVLTPLEEKRLTLLETVSRLLIIGPFSIPVIIIALLPVLFISGVLIERWMTFFQHSPRDKILNKIALMMPISSIIMISLGFIGLGLQVSTESGSPLLLETIIANIIMGALLSTTMGWIWWRHVMHHDFKGGIIISRDRILKKRAL